MIREQYADFELIGEPEVCEIPDVRVDFNPYRKPREQ